MMGGAASRPDIDRASPATLPEVVPPIVAPRKSATAVAVLPTDEPSASAAGGSFDVLQSYSGLEAKAGQTYPGMDEAFANMFPLSEQTSEVRARGAKRELRPTPSRRSRDRSLLRGKHAGDQRDPRSPRDVPAR